MAFCIPSPDRPFWPRPDDRLATEALAIVPQGELSFQMGITPIMQFSRTVDVVLDSAHFSRNARDSVLCFRIIGE